jgi:hypothetical protein
MYTRKQRLDNECSHREFYGQFVTPSIISSIVGRIGADRILKSTDEHMNDIPLADWDKTAFLVRGRIQRGYKEIEYTGGVSLSDCVCTAKEAARQFVESV